MRCRYSNAGINMSKGAQAIHDKASKLIRRAFTSGISPQDRRDMVLRAMRLEVDAALMLPKDHDMRDVCSTRIMALAAKLED